MILIILAKYIYITYLRLQLVLIVNENVIWPEMIQNWHMLSNCDFKCQHGLGQMLLHDIEITPSNKTKTGHYFNLWYFYFCLFSETPRTQKSILPNAPWIWIYLPVAWVNQNTNITKSETKQLLDIQIKIINLY